MNKKHNADNEQMTGARVLILSGSFKGCEAVYLGKTNSMRPLWAVSPDAAPNVLELRFPRDFALLMDLSADPTRN